VTYAGFLALFVVVPLAATLWCVGGALRRGGWRPMLALLVIVYVATTPWDNAAVARGLWDFDPARVAGVTLGWLPIEEYLFFGLQALLTGILVLDRLGQR
jgi:lycopene cyclase domain-containing protein